MPEFIHKSIRIGRVTISFVRNVTLLSYFQVRPYGGLLAWEPELRWLAATIRIRTFCLNLDVDLR